MHYALLPGHAEIIYAPMPPDPTNSWTVELRYTAQMNAAEEKLWLWLRPVRPLRRLLPHDGAHFAYDAWHVGTNLVTSGDLAPTEEKDRGRLKNRHDWAWR
jgi:hypothetical protein